MIFGKGFNKQFDLMTAAIDKGVIVKKGQIFFFGSDKLGRGMPAVREALKDETLSAKVQEALR